MINQKAIAHSLGLSIMTVSRALRNHPGLSEPTKARVIQKAREMGYTRFALPSETSQQRRVAVLAFEWREFKPQLFESFVHRAIFLALQQECQRQGVETVVEFPKANEIPVCIKNDTISGAFIFGRYTAEDIAPLKSLPTLAVSSFIAGQLTARIMADNVGGMAEVTEHFIRAGHKKIFYLGQKDEYTELFRERENGYVHMMYRYGLTPRSAFMRSEEIADHISTILSHTAVACSSDSMAYSLLKVLHERGAKVPDDCAVAGFDDIPSQTGDALTTYAPNWSEMGTLAANLMLLNSSSLQNSSVKVTVPGQLIIRNTSQRLPVSQS